MRVVPKAVKATPDALTMPWRGANIGCSDHALGYPRLLDTIAAFAREAVARRP